MAGTLRKRGRIWWGRIKKAGKVHERSLETESKSVARDRLAAWTRELTDARWGVRPTRTLHQAIERFADEHFRYLKPSSAKRYAVSIDSLIAGIKDCALADIGSEVLKRFETRRLAAGVSASTVRRDLACLSSIFSRAEEWEWVTANPVKPYLRGRANAGLTEAEARTRHLSIAEESAILQELGEAARAAVAFAIDTGLRREEQFSLLWSDVDLAGNWIHVRAEVAKSGRARQVAILPRARRWLLQQKRGSSYVFTSRAGTRYSPNSPTMYEALQRACRRAGVVEHLTWHDLRRTCGCRLLQSHGFPMEDVSQWLGHADIRITQKRYAFLQVSRLQKFLARGTSRGTVEHGITSKALEDQALSVLH